MNLYILRHASAGLRRTNPRPRHQAPPRQRRQEALPPARSRAQRAEHPVRPHRLQPTQALPPDRLAHRHRDRLRSPDPAAPTALAPDATFKDFQKLLREHSTSENLLVVGHNPNLTSFLGSLLVPATSPEAKVRLRKGSLARVVLTRGPATLQGLLDPRTVRALYATSTKSSRRKTSRK